MTDKDRIEALEAENKRLQGIVDQIEDVFIVDWITVKNNDYRQAMFDWLEWNMNVQADPCVSGEAREKYMAMAKLVPMAFVDGAKWWEFKRSGFTMWQSDQYEAYEQFMNSSKYQLAHDVMKRLEEERDMEDEKLRYTEVPD